MNEAFWYPTIHWPGETWEDGSPLYRLTSDRALPHTIVVDADGERFANESVNYNDFGRTFHEFDPQAFDYANLPVYQIMDATFRKRYAMAGLVRPEDDCPKWISRAGTLAGLAEAIDVDPDGLRVTVAAFNEAAQAGEDPAFGRARRRTSTVSVTRTPTIRTSAPSSRRRSTPSNSTRAASARRVGW